MDGIPPLCLPVCKTCGCPDARVKNEVKCTNCPPGQVWFASARAVAVFSGVAQTLVAKLKYQHRLEYAPVIARAMANDFVRAGGTADIIIPVPLHSTRLRERGFNQSAVLARHFAEICPLQVLEKVLIRQRPTPTQTRLKKGERRKNVAGAFVCTDPVLIQGKHVLLIDDVYTTGSTLNECAKVLRDAGAESVECLAYCRAVLG
jgi:ComF family protein